MILTGQALLLLDSSGLVHLMKMMSGVGGYGGRFVLACMVGFALASAGLEVQVLEFPGVKATSLKLYQSVNVRETCYYTEMHILFGCKSGNRALYIDRSLARSFGSLTTWQSVQWPRWLGAWARGNEPRRDRAADRGDLEGLWPGHSDGFLLVRLPSLTHGHPANVCRAGEVGMMSMTDHAGRKRLTRSPRCRPSCSPWFRALEIAAGS